MQELIASLDPKLSGPIVRNVSTVKGGMLSEERRKLTCERRLLFAGGFSLFEMLVAMVILSVLAGIAVASFGEYARRTAAVRSAEVFARDLTIARTAAVGERIPVTIVFDESERSYLIRKIGGEILLTRNFGMEGEIPLSSIDLDIDGDSIVFNERGILAFHNLGSSLVAARFEGGGRSYVVSFNALGTSAVVGP